MNKDLSVTIFPFLKINLLIFPVIASSIIWDYSTEFALSYICAILHEFAHIAAALPARVKISCVEFQPFGVCARLGSDIIENPVSEILIALAGPLFSLTLAIASCLTGIFSDYFVQCNLALAIINLLPILPLDGGRMLRAALTLRTGAMTAYNTTVKISRIPLVLIILLSVYTFLTARFNFSLILIGAFLLGNLFAEQHNISRQALQELLHYKDKLKPGDLNRAYVLCADKSTPARKILRHLSYNRYHIIHVTDSNTRIIKTLTESQLLESVTERGVRVTLGEI